MEREEKEDRAIVGEREREKEEGRRVVGRRVMLNKNFSGRVSRPQMGFSLAWGLTSVALGDRI